MEFSVLWGGILSGSIYGFIGLAYLVVLRGTKTLNFAVGGLVGFGAVAGATWQRDVPQWAAFALTVAAAAAVSVAIDLAVTQPIQRRQAGHFGVVMALAAAFFVVVQLTGQLFTPAAVLGQPIIDGVSEFADATLSNNSLAIVALALLVSGAIWAWMRYGRQGRLLSAIGDEAEAAVLLCLPIRGIRLLAVGIGGALAGLVGFLIVGSSPVTFQSSFSFALVGLIALMLGGVASAWGPLAGGLIIGLVDTFGARWIGASVRDYTFVVVIVMVFALRPEGLFAARIRY
jgi:branched-subunit amino acid ABC-type transport system permease component